MLSLLSAVAEDQPLVCAIDDAQWLDAASSQVIGFVARRLMAESLGLVIAVRESAGRRPFDGLPELAIGGLDDDAARTLLTAAVPARLDERVRTRVLAETRGNPLALLELPRHMSAAALAGGFEVPRPTDVPADIEDSYLRRIHGLPERSQRLLLVAAAEPVGDAMLIWRAAQALAIEGTALAPAEDAGLIALGAQVQFRHPLVRSAVYRAASIDERREVHQALAEACDPVLDTDLRTWHRALAAAGRDDDVASDLEVSAGRAASRGGLAAAAALLERAASLTTSPAHRARRALLAAQAKHQSGEPNAALALLASARAGSLDDLGHAKADVLDAQITFSTNRGREAPGLLLRAARQLEPLDVVLARETYLEALTAAQFAGRLAEGAVLEVARAARTAPPAPSPQPHDVLLDAMALMVTDGHAAAAPLLRSALDAFRDGDADTIGGFRWLWLAEEAAQELWDHDAWLELSVRQLELVRTTGALSILPLAFSAVICSRIYAGELTAAASLIHDQQNATEATGSRLAPYGAMIEAAWRGREAELTALTDQTLEEVLRRGEGIGVSTCQWVTAVLYNGLGHYDRALDSARAALQPARRLDWTVNVTLPEFVEAAVRTGHLDAARGALEQLVALTRPSGSDWALGLEARCRALVSDVAAAEPLYREAIERLGATRLRGEHARAHLLYGEWLRAGRRTRDAQEPLRTGHLLFVDIGMEAFADRAARELIATGVTVPARQAATEHHLTPQERRIARPARDGLSNPEIGSELFLSPRTVEWHLRKAYTKLGVRSRRELARMLRDAERE